MIFTKQISGKLYFSAASRFIKWLDSVEVSSYDPYDIWELPYNLWSRKMYYRCPIIGIPLIAPCLIGEMICPALRKLVAKMNHFATADAQLILSFANLFRLTNENIYLLRARNLEKRLRGYGVPGYQGFCWGYPFNWQSQRGMWASSTPFITCTPYCYQVYIELHELTGDGKYFVIAESIAKFVYYDLNDTLIEKGSAVSSYSPKDGSQVINACAYRAWVLFDAAKRFGRMEWIDKAAENLTFIVNSQLPDGAWLYSTDGHGNYIDHFHTCFVLKKLNLIAFLFENNELERTLSAGYKFYQQKLFYANGLPKMYARTPRTDIVRLEMYDLGEAISLGVALKSKIPEAYVSAGFLADVLCERFQLARGHFVTRVYRGGIVHSFPFLRWPQAQLFYALTNLLLSTC